MSIPTTYCVDNACPSKDDCVRFTLKPKGKRIFFRSPRNKKKKRCEFFEKRPLNPMERENVNG